MRAEYQRGRPRGKRGGSQIGGGYGKRGIAADALRRLRRACFGRDSGLTALRGYTAVPSGRGVRELGCSGLIVGGVIHARVCRGAVAPCTRCCRTGARSRVWLASWRCCLERNSAYECKKGIAVGVTSNHHIAFAYLCTIEMGYQKRSITSYAHFQRS